MHAAVPSGRAWFLTPGGPFPGIEGFTQHVRRHFFTSFTVNSGVPERAVDIWLNHADGSVRQRYYHLSPEESQAFMQTVPFDETAETNTTEALVGRAS